MIALSALNMLSSKTHFLIFILLFTSTTRLQHDAEMKVDNSLDILERKATRESETFEASD